MTKVRILATCRKPELLKYTLMVFDTIRVGFPTSEIVVHGNALALEQCKVVDECCQKNRCTFIDIGETIHHEWIGRLLETESDPFVIVDTDMIFFESVEHWKFDAALAGRRIPEWNDEFSGCLTRSRLHTSLLFIDPKGVMRDVGTWASKVPNTAFTPIIDLINPMVLPLKTGRIFYDTCALLYHAIGGQRFTESQLDAFSHMNFGTIPDIVLPRLSNGAEMEKRREEIVKSPEKARGIWRQQELYYEARQ